MAHNNKEDRREGNNSETDGLAQLYPTDRRTLLRTTAVGTAGLTGISEMVTAQTVSELLQLPFTEDFQTGLKGWTVDQRYRLPTQGPNPGDGGHSDKHGGSVRLSVDGGPSTIGVGRQTSGISADTKLSATIEVENASSEPGNVSIAIFAPNGDDKYEERTSNNGNVSNGTIELTHTVQSDYNSGAEIRVWADVWPGDFDAYVTQIEATTPDSARSVSFEQTSVGAPKPADPWSIVKDPTSDSFNSVEISSDHATDGSQTLHMTGNGDLDRILVGVDADLSDVATVRCDVYIKKADVSWGEIWFGRWLDGESDKRIGFMGQTGEGSDRFDKTGEFTDLEGDMSDLSGEHEIVFNMRGNNEAYFDNLRFLNSAGEMLSPTDIISGRLTASFNYTPDAPTAQTVVTFDGSSSVAQNGSIQSYDWDFTGDGSTDATGVVVEHVYEEPGNYTVTLTVTDSQDSTTTETVSLSVDPATLPVAIDDNNNGVIDDGEIDQATQYWQNGTEVPGTDGKTISDSDLLELTRMWRNETEVDS